MTGTASLQLLEVATRNLVPAELAIPISEKQLSDWKTHWYAENQIRIQQLIKANVPRAEWPQSLHWEWDNKLNGLAKLLTKQSFAITCQDLTQGLMLVDLSSTIRARLPKQKGKDIVYVEYLEVAPWNWKDARFAPPVYSLIGSHLMAAAIEFSIQQDFKGRIGLHSLPQSVPFYERIGMTNLGIMDSKYPKLPYFEFSEESAQNYIEKGEKK